jgi:hypothetical protein
MPAIPELGALWRDMLPPVQDAQKRLRLHQNQSHADNRPLKVLVQGWQLCSVVAVVLSANR